MVTVQEATQGVPATIRCQRSPIVLEGEMGLVVHAVEALDDRFLDLVDAFRQGAGLGVDAPDRVVVDLDLQVLRPAPIAPQPGRAVVLKIAHPSILPGRAPRRLVWSVGARRALRIPTFRRV